MRCTEGCNGQVRDNLGQVIQCESHVNTRLRYVQKSVVTTGSQKKVVTVQTTFSQYEYAVSVDTDLNAPNGVFITNDTESGADLTPKTENKYVVNET